MPYKPCLELAAVTILHTVLWTRPWGFCTLPLHRYMPPTHLAANVAGVSYCQGPGAEEAADPQDPDTCHGAP